MLRALGHEASPAAVAALYEGLIDAIVIDDVDSARAEDIARRGIDAVVTDTIMRDAAAKRSLARVALEAAGIGSGDDA